MNWRNNTDFWYAFNITASVLILFFAIAVPLLSAFTSFTKTVDIKAVQTTAIPAFTESSFTIDIDNASTTPLNAVEFELVYNPKEIQLLRIVPHATLCEERFIISNKIDTTLGTALFQCGTVTPFS